MGTSSEVETIRFDPRVLRSGANTLEFVLPDGGAEGGAGQEASRLGFLYATLR